MTPTLTHPMIAALIIGMLLSNFALRYISLAALTRLRLPRLVMRWLSYVPVAVMGALIATEVLIPAADAAPVTPLYLNPGLYGAAAAMLAFRFTKSFIGSTLAGIALFALIRWLTAA